MNAKEKLKRIFESLADEEPVMEQDNDFVPRTEYEQDMDKVVGILNKMKEEMDTMNTPPEPSESVTEETEEEMDDEVKTEQDELEVKTEQDELEEDDSTPQDEPAVAPKTMEKKRKMKSNLANDPSTPQDETGSGQNMEPSKEQDELEEDDSTPQDEPAVAPKTMEKRRMKNQLEDEVKSEQDELEEQEDEVAEQEEPTPPIEEKLSLKDLDKKNDDFKLHLKEAFGM